MNSWLSECLILCISGSILCSILSRGSRLKHYVCMVLSFVLVISLINSFVSMISFIGDLDISSELSLDENFVYTAFDYKMLVIEKTGDNLKKEISSIARQRYNILLSSDKITIEYDDTDIENVLIKKVLLDLREVYVIMNAKELEEYITELLCCDCEVILP